MVDQLGAGLGSRERRWLFVFLALGSAYFAVLLLRAAIDLLGAFSSILLVVFLAWLLAFVMSPLVGFLQRRVGVPRALAAVIAYLAALIGLGFVLFYSGSAATQQVADATRAFPETARRIEQTLAGWQQSLNVGRLQIDLVALFKSVEAQGGVIAGAIFGQAQAIAGATAAAVGSFVLILILSLYMVMDSERILSKINRIVPRRYADELEILERSVARAFGGFLRAQVILAAIQVVLVAAVGIVFGIPYLFLIGTLSAIAMLIPFFGPPLALIPPIAAAWVYTDALLPVALILIVTQTLIVNWLQPRLMQGALGMHPILVLVGLLVGAQVAGVWGALFGIPVIAVLNVFFNYFVNLQTIADSQRVDPEAVVQAVKDDAPGASKELVVARAAELAEAVEEARGRERTAASVGEAAGAIQAAAEGVEDSAQAVRDTAGEVRKAAREVHDTSSEVREAAGEVREAAGEVRDSVERLADERR